MFNETFLGKPPPSHHPMTCRSRGADRGDALIVDRRPRLVTLVVIGEGAETRPWSDLERFKCFIPKPSNELLEHSGDPYTVVELFVELLYVPSSLIFGVKDYWHFFVLDPPLRLVVQSPFFLCHRQHTWAT